MQVSLLAAVSVDMFIAPLDQELLPSTLWTSKEDKRFFTQKSKELQVMIMGATTFATMGRVLPERTSIVLTRRPEVLTQEFLQKEQVSQLPAALRFTNEEPEKLLTTLAQQGVEQVALCGGAQIYSLFLEKNLVDTLYLTMEPVIFGQGVSLFHYPEKLMKRLQLSGVTKLNEQGTLLLEYQILKM